MRKINAMPFKQNDAALTVSLRQLMHERNINEAELSRQTTIPQATLHKIITGKTADPRISTLQTLAAFFDISLDELVSGATSSTTSMTTSQTQSVAILSWHDCLTHKKHVASLNPSNWEHWITINSSAAKAYALTSKPCLEPRFPRGTTLVIDPETDPVDGDLVVVHYPGTNEATLRELSADGPIKQLLTVGTSQHQDEFCDDIALLGVVLESRFMCHSQ